MPYDPDRAANTTYCTFKDSQLTYPLPPNYFNIWLSDGDDLGRADTNTLVTGEVTLSIGAKLTWTPSYPGDTSLPPLSVDVLETGRAGVDTNVNPPPGVADDGLGDPIVYTSGSVTSQGNYLHHLAVPMGQTSVTLPGRLLSASRPDVPGGDPMMNTYVNYSVVQDTRAVTLHRDGARQVPKTAGLGGKVYGEWVDPDGTGHGDTTYSYQELTHAGKTQSIIDHPNWQTFTPVFQGTWPVWSSTYQYPQGYPLYMYLGDPNDPLYLNSGSNDATVANARTRNAPAVSWAWSPDESDDWELSGKWFIPYGSGGPQTPTPHDPVTLPMSYSVTESSSGFSGYQTNTTILDDASASTRYFLTIHDPVDGWHTNGPLYEIDPLQFPYVDDDKNPIKQLSGTTLQTSFPAQLDYLDYGPGVKLGGALLTGGSAILPVAVSGPVGIGLASLMAFTGFYAGLYDNPAPMVHLDVTADETSFYAAIADQNVITSGTAVTSPRSSPNYVAYPQVARFADPTKATYLASLSADKQFKYWHGTGDGGTYQVSATDILPQVVQPYAAYQFDTAGLIVDTNGNPVYALANITHAGTPVAILTWTFVPLPKPH